MIFNLVGTWEMIRAAGIVSYFLFWLSTCAGILYSEKVFVKKRAILLLIHQNCGWFAFLFVMLHGALLIVDNYMPYSVMEIFIPFSANNEPILSGIGTLTFLFYLIILVSSDLLRILSKKVWKWIHILTIPTFVLMLFHSFFIGTDSLTPGMLILYAFTVTIFLFLIAYKGVNYRFHKTYKKMI